MSSRKDIRGPGRPPAERAADVRAALIAAARTRIVEVGFAAASTKDIAARAGVNAAMINYYFGGKAALGEAAFRATIEPLRERLEALAAAERTDADIRSFLREYMRALAANPWIPRLVVREVLPENGQFRRIFFAEIVGRGAAMLPRVLSKAQADGRMAPNVSPLFATISIASLAVFPFLAAGILRANLNVNVSDAGTLDQLVDHTMELLETGLQMRA